MPLFYCLKGGFRAARCSFACGITVAPRKAEVLQLGISPCPVTKKEIFHVSENQGKIQGKDSAWTVTKDDKSYIKWSHTLGQAGTQYASCRVSYVGPNGKPIEGIAYVKDYDAKSKTNQQLEVYAPVTSKTEAKELAAKKLRLHNKFERQVGFTYHGDPGKVAGLTFETKSFGPWDGKYIVKQAKHTVTGSGGYTTQVSGRHVLGGY